MRNKQRVSANNRREVINMERMKYKISLFLLLISLQANSQCVESIATASGHSGYIDSEGKLFTWGRNTNGQLGNGTTVDEHSPMILNEQEEWLTLGSWNGYSNASTGIKKDGTLWRWEHDFNYNVAPSFLTPQVNPDND